MAESLAILGLASNIISIIDFGLKVVSGVRTVRDSIHGTTAEVRELDLILDDVRSFNDLVVLRKVSGQKFSADELRIQDMVKECENVSTEIRKAISSLKMKDGRLKALESRRIVLLSMWKKGDIEALQGRLEKLDQRIRTNILQALQNKQNSTIATSLESLKKAQQSLEINYDAKMDLLRDEVIRIARQSREKEMASQAAQLASLKTKLDLLGKEHFECTTQTKIIEILYHPVIRKRWNQIPKADETSNNWVFNSRLTPFKAWLESEHPQDGLFCITGRAGSGKSTLMKYIAGDPRTTKSLEGWASPAKLCTASFFFWNQGYEMQKNLLGLFQSLLYQILRSVPTLIPLVCLDRQNHEAWEIPELQKTFELIAAQQDLDVKFCFFIDGLDEYNGAEEEVVEVLKFLSMSSDIKICASTRPRSVFERFFAESTRTFDISNFTKEDMRQHVRQNLQDIKSFRQLEKTDPSCADIIRLIAEMAQGVWLWVFLVTRDLKHAVNRDEGIVMLRKIVHQFPSDLEAYFERIIKAVRPQYLEEMSQIFLVTVDELQPLPLYAFSLLENERSDLDYAIKAPIKPLYDDELHGSYPKWKSLIQNRCSDLLVVDSDAHPLFLSHSVDFLHRTVRDFLQDSYYTQLHDNLKSDFNPTASLCKMCLVLLKSLPVTNFKDPATLNKIIGLTDELLYYAHETEKRSDSPDTPLVEVLDELDIVNSHHARSIRNHWTHARDSPPARGLDEYHEGGNCNFLALAVQARLFKYVRAKVQADPSNMQKQGRPLLDYALRPRRSTPISMPYHSQRDDPSLDVNMVQLLLEHGADPNRLVRLNDDRTVWALFLLSIHESAAQIQAGGSKKRITLSLTNAWYKACELLIRHGACEDCYLVKDRPEVTVRVILEGAFGYGRALQLQALMREKKEAQQSNRSCITM